MPLCPWWTPLYGLPVAYIILPLGLHAFDRPDTVTMVISKIPTVFLLWINLNVTLSLQIFEDNQVSRNVYVSLTSGKDSLSCGLKLHPCKTIAMGVWQVQHDGRVYIDGTGSEMNPYTCKSFAIDLPGIHSNKSMVIIGVQAIPHVKCQEGYNIVLGHSLLNHSVTTVHLINLKFVNTSVSAQDISLHIVDCIFTGASQAAVNLVQSTRVFGRSCMHIVSSLFEKFQTKREGVLNLSSERNMEVHIENATFANNLVMQNGGCVTMNGSQSIRLIMKDSTFTNNSAVRCGGVMWLFSKMSIDTTIQGCHFAANTAGDFAGLGAFQGKNVNVEILDSTVNRNVGGGVINIGWSCGGHSEKVMNASLLFRNVTMIKSYTLFNNPSLFYVGVSVIKACFGSFTIQDSTITDVRMIDWNGVGEFFAFYVFSHKFKSLSSKSGFDIKILNSTVENKSAKIQNSSGFLYSDGYRELTLENAVIESFKGLFVSSSSDRNTEAKVSITNSIIRNSSNKGFGGAIYLGSVSSLNITNTLLESNTADSAGCLYIPPGNYDVYLRNVTFKRCWSLRYDGGAVLIDHGGSRITFESCKFLENTALGGSGGAIAVVAQRGQITNPGCINKQESHRVWSHNTSVMIKNTVFINNTARRGGAVFIANGNITFKECLYVDNFANVQGGHIFITSDSTRVQVLDSIFQQNNSDKNVELGKRRGYFYINSFINSQSEGPLRLLNSRLNSSLFGQSYTLVTVTRSNYVDFGKISKINSTNITCSRGNTLEIMNLTTKVEAEYKSQECILKQYILMFVCKPCEEKTYSLQHGQWSSETNQIEFANCLPCPDVGAYCLNGRISAMRDFWGFINDNWEPFLGTELIFTPCPLGYCLSPRPGDLDYNSCHGNRAGILCGKCKENFTETLLSTSCRDEDDCQDTWFWVVAVAMVLLMALYLIHKPRFALKRHILWFRNNTNSEDERQSGGEYSHGYLKIMFYFYQAANILLTTTASEAIVGSFLPFIALSQDGFVCPLVGITVVTKQLALIFLVFGVHIMIAVCYGCHCLLHKCRSESLPTLAPYIGATLEAFLLGYAVLANTAIKLLHCPIIAGTRRLFIDGNEPCNQWWQYVLLAYVVLVAVPLNVTLALGSRWLYKGLISVKEFFIGCIIPLPYLTYKLISLLHAPQEPGPEPPEWKASVTAVLYGPFRKPQDNIGTGAIYWESILIFRRLLLITINEITPYDVFNLKGLALTLACVIILLHHITVLPFSSKAANRAETVSLFSLVVMSLFNNPYIRFHSFGQMFIVLTLPLLFVLAVVAAVISQFIRLVVKVCKILYNIGYYCIHQSRGWYVITDVL